MILVHRSPGRLAQTALPQVPEAGRRRSRSGTATTVPPWSCAPSTRPSPSPTTMSSAVRRRCSTRSRNSSGASGSPSMATWARPPRSSSRPRRAGTTRAASLRGRSATAHPGPPLARARRPAVAGPPSMPAISSTSRPSSMTRTTTAAHTTSRVCRTRGTKPSGSSSSTASADPSSRRSNRRAPSTSAARWACSSRRYAPVASTPAGSTSPAGRSGRCPPGLRPFCRVGSITDEIEGQLRPHHLHRGPRASAAVLGRGECRESVPPRGHGVVLVDPGRLRRADPPECRAGQLLGPAVPAARFRARRRLRRHVPRPARHVVPPGGDGRGAPRRRLRARAVADSADPDARDRSDELARVQRADRRADAEAGARTSSGGTRSAWPRSGTTPSAGAPPRTWRRSRRCAGTRRTSGAWRHWLSMRDAEFERRLRDTKIFRYTANAAPALRPAPGREVVPARPHRPSGGVHPADGSYETWIELFDTLDDEGRRRIEARLQALPDRPRISVLMPVYDPPVDLLQAAIDSVREPDLSGLGALHRRRLLHRPARWSECSTTTPAPTSASRSCDGTENGHISAASNSALDWRTGRWVALLDHDDVLAPHALALVALALAEHPDAAHGLQRRGQDRRSGTPARPLLQARLRSRCCSWARTSSAICPCSARTWWTGPGVPRGVRGQPGLGPHPAGQRARVGGAGRAHPSCPVPLARARELDGGARVGQAVRRRRRAARRGRSPGADRAWRPGDADRQVGSQPGGLGAARPGTPGQHRGPDHGTGGSCSGASTACWPSRQYPDFEVVVVDNSSESLPTLAVPPGLRRPASGSCATSGRSTTRRINNAAVQRTHRRRRLPPQRRHRGHLRRVAHGDGEPGAPAGRRRRRRQAVLRRRRGSSTPGSSWASAASPVTHSACSTACRPDTSATSSWRTGCPP